MACRPSPELYLTCLRVSPICWILNIEVFREVGWVGRP